MAGSPKKRAKRLAKEAAAAKQNTSSGIPHTIESAPTTPQQDGTDKPAPTANTAVPVVQGEILPPQPGTDPTRTALKRAMRQRAQTHAEAAISVLVAALSSLDEKARIGAANDLLAWGFGKPATEIEAGEGAQMIVIRRFGDPV